MIRAVCLLVIANFALAQGPPESVPYTSLERVEVVVFSDFQCPFCKQFSQSIRDLQTKGVPGIQTTVTFKHFPLSFHPDSQLAHQAALAAGQQGKFWEMHDLLFVNQSALKRDGLLGYAKALGLDMERFRRDLDSDRLKQVVERDKAEGSKLAVSGTPTFFVNGRAYSGTRTFDQLKDLILGEERRKRALSEITDNLMSRGPGTAPVTLEFFADLESPVTRAAISVLDQVVRQYPSTVRVQFRNFPLAFHPQAPLAHEAAMIAARKGDFWEFMQFILDYQDGLREQDLIAYAGRLGFEEAPFAEMLHEHRYAARVEADLAEGSKRDLRGSPVVFVNSKRIDGVPSPKVLIDYIEAELAAKK